MTRRAMHALPVVVAFMALAVGATQSVAQVPPIVPYGAPITLDQAKAVVVAAEAEVAKNSWAMAIAIVDTGGNLVLFHRTDNTMLASIELAKGKAWSALAFRRPTKALEDAIAAGGQGLRLLRIDGLYPIEGGIPILVDGKIIGAIGVSGGTSGQDAQVAAAAVAAVK